jgi:hypothetical protein
MRKGSVANFGPEQEFAERRRSRKLRAPIRILKRHAMDEAPNLITYSRPAASGLRSPTPVPAPDASRQQFPASR